MRHNNSEKAIRKESKDPVFCRNKLRQLEDKRVHLVLYFFGGGHSIRDADFKALRKITKAANVIPIVSMADAFTAEELKAYKLKIIEHAVANKIHFFNCSDSLNELVSDNDELIKVKMNLLTNKISGVCPPFAIVNPQFNCEESKTDNHCNCENSKEKLGRHKIQGFVDSGSPCFDFGQLYQLLFGYLTLTLAETTNFITINFIEQYNDRVEKIKRQ